MCVLFRAILGEVRDGPSVDAWVGVASMARALRASDVFNQFEMEMGREQYAGSFPSE